MITWQDKSNCGLRKNKRIKLGLYFDQSPSSYFLLVLMSIVDDLVKILCRKALKAFGGECK